MRRDWWPFPGDLLDFTDLFEIAIGLVFVVLWPFWFLTKFLGARWVVVVECGGHEKGRELVRGGSKANTRVNQIAYEIAGGHRSGDFVL